MVNYTYNDIIMSLTEKLTEAGISNAHWEARELAGCALGFNCRGRFDGKKQADCQSDAMFHKAAKCLRLQNYSAPTHRKKRGE